MSQLLKEKCVKDAGLCKYVSYRARKIQYHYKSYLDVEDAQNNLWVSVFSAIDTHKPTEDTVINFARNVVYSSYGHALPSQTHRRNLQLTFEENIVRGDDIASHIECSDFTPLEDLKITLDSIDADLKRRWGQERMFKGKMHLLAYHQFCLMRMGYSNSEINQELGISPTYASTLKQKILIPYLQNQLRES